MPDSSNYEPGYPNTTRESQYSYYQQTQTYGSQAAGTTPRYEQPQAPYRAQATQYAQPARAAHAAASTGQTVAVKQTSGVKVFLISFLGALLAFAVAFGGYTMYQRTQVSETPAVEDSRAFTLSSPTTTTINATGEDIHLAEAVAAKALPSVVCINVYTSQSSYYGYGYGMFGGRGTESSELEVTSLGSGIVLTSDGYILTNYHVVEGGEAYKVNVGDAEYDAVLVGSDPSSDLAVIKADATGLVPAEIGDSDDLNVGEWVMTIGSPFGLEQSVATGVVSATSRSQFMEETSTSDPYSYLYGGGSSSSNLTLYPNLIQTDAAINPGNSGGALVDAEGKVIGINTLITSYSGNYSGVGFAIPINYAYNIATQIIDGKTPTHARLGVSLTTVTSNIASRYNLSEKYGAYVSVVAEGSGAANAGVKEGDIIIAINGSKMESSTDVTLAVREHNPGDTITLTVNRSGEKVDLQVKLGSDQEEALTTPSSYGTL